MSIVRTDIPTTSQICEETIDALARRYPFLGVATIGTTAFGRPIRAMTLGTGPRNVIFSAAHHANEWITATLLLKFAEDLAAAMETDTAIYGVPAQTIRRYSRVHILPMVNPDGVDLVTGALAPGEIQYEHARALSENYPAIPFPEGWKANLLGVDLNLQYPAGWEQAREIKFSQGYTRPGPRDFVGRGPLTQREARALAQYTADIDPALTVAFHTQGQVIYWQFQDYAVTGARELAEEFARVSGYALEETPYASSFAGYKDWFIQDFRRPGFTVEVGLGENPLPLQQFDQIYRENLGILVTAATGLPGGV